MEQSHSWKANWLSVYQENPRILWNPKVHYLVTCPILIQNNPVHALPSSFLKIHVNIILPSNPGSSKWSFPPQFPLYAPFLSQIYATCQAQLFFSIWSPE